MNKIINFPGHMAYNAYVKSKCVKELGTGSEGTCYLGKDGLAYKDLSEGFRMERYIPEDIITTADVKSDSFYFPHVLFTIGDELMGYTSDVVKQDLTNHYYLLDHGIDHIDFDKLYTAYEVMCEEAIRLAEEGIAIYDLSHNLLFDGERLIGVDTCGYYRAPVMECTHNTACVDMAVKDLFTMYAEYGHGDKLDTDMEVKEFLALVKKKYSSTDGKGSFIKK